jgi:hypothetical protein
MTNDERHHRFRIGFRQEDDYRVDNADSNENDSNHSRAPTEKLMMPQYHRHWPFSKQYRQQRQRRSFLRGWKIGITLICLAGLVAVWTVIDFHGSSDVTNYDMPFQKNSTSTLKSNSKDQHQILEKEKEQLSSQHQQLEVSTTTAQPSIRVTPVHELNKTETTPTEKLKGEEDDPILHQLSSDLASYLRNNPLYQTLRNAMGTVELQSQTEVLKSLPQVWDNIIQLYYSNKDQNASSSMETSYNQTNDVIVIGMDTCATYREQVPYERRYAGVAGLFNTGAYA